LVGSRLKFMVIFGFPRLPAPFFGMLDRLRPRTSPGCHHPPPTPAFAAIAAGLNCVRQKISRPAEFGEMSKKMPITRRALLATSAALATSPLARARAAGENIIRIGVLTDLSGQYRDNSGPTSVLAAQQAVEDFRPEQYGFKVEILSGDHRQKPDIASALAREWYDRDGVDAIADLNNTAVALAVNTVSTEKDKAQLNTGPASGDLTGKYCNPNMVHFAPDTWCFSHATGTAIMKQGGDSWFLVVADYTFGHALEQNISTLVTGAGGKVLGAARYPFPGTTDFSSYLLEAQTSGAKVLGLCNTGGDMENCVKQAREFGLAKQGMKIAALLGFVTEIHSMGLETAQGLLVSDTFYWDTNDRTRAFTERFIKISPHNYPSSLHASCYAGVTHYLRAVAKLGVPAAKGSGRAAIAAMKAIPTDDDCFGHQQIRPDGRFITPVFLMEAKTPAESKMPWDVLKIVATTPADEAFRPLAEKACPMLKS
jgi:branched-chain amino acid transport system substrate-binding protein